MSVSKIEPGQVWRGNVSGDLKAIMSITDFGNEHGVVARLEGGDEADDIWDRDEFLGRHTLVTPAPVEPVSDGLQVGGNNGT